MKRIGAAGNFFLGTIVTLLLVAQLSFTGNEKEKHHGFLWVQEQTNRWNVPQLPEQISFAGEKVPMGRWDVKEKFDKEFLQNYFSQGAVIYLIKLANRNFPVISERLRANGVPDDFKYLCIAESNMQSWATSSSGAVGYWQFLKGTASGYGLEANAQVDQRRDLIKSTDAACRYLKAAYAKFGNWTAAAASYNCGMGGYASRAAFQRTKNYYDLQLPEETNKYVFRILTFKYLIENADKLGFNVGDDDLYPPVPTRTVVVTSAIADLAKFAIDNGTTYKMLINLNPWLRGKSLSVSKGKTYTIKLPAQAVGDAQAKS